MRLKTKLRLINTATGITLIAALGVCAMAILSTPSPKPIADGETSQLVPFIPLEQVEFPKSSELKGLVKKRLQGPPPPKPAAKAKSRSQPKQNVPWPNLTVEHIILGSPSNASIKLNNKTRTCSEGDLIEQVLVEEIGAGFVVVSLQGEKKTLKKIH